MVRGLKRGKARPTGGIESPVVRRAGGFRGLDPDTLTAGVATLIFTSPRQYR